MQLQILKLESSDDEILTTFSNGLHKVGRGPLLQCNDKRISRDHAEIQVTNTEAKITALHLNPCFIKLSDSKTITILSKDTTADLHDGDKFAFLPDRFWFKVRIIFEESVPVPEIDNTNENVTVKRELEDTYGFSPEKRIKSEPGEEKMGEHSNSEVKLEQIDDIDIKPEVKVEVKTENEDIDEPVDIKMELVEFKLECDEIKVEEIKVECDEIKQEEVKVECNEIKQEEGKLETGVIAEADSTTSACTSTTKRRQRCRYAPNCYRKNLQHKAEYSHPGDPDYDTKVKVDPNSSTNKDRCWYGSDCYRKNQEHKACFSHPQDPDYDSDPNDYRPVCQFGASCYRKNPKHRQQFKHPPKQRRRARQVAPNQYLDNVDDDDEERDPFACDGDDSDEYQAHSSSTSSSADSDDLEHFNDNEEVN